MYKICQLSITPQKSLCSFTVNPCSYPSPQTITILLSGIFLSWKFHINRILHYVGFLCAWLLWVSITLLRFFDIIVYIIASLLFSAEEWWHWNTTFYFFTHQSFGSFPLRSYLLWINLLWTFLYTFVGTYISISLG